jgi:hypothetical protein
VVAWRRIREGMVCARPRRNSGILSLEEKTQKFSCHSGCVTQVYLIVIVQIKYKKYVFLLCIYRESIDFISLMFSTFLL